MFFLVEQHVKWFSTHWGPFPKTGRHPFLYVHSNLVTLYKTFKLWDAFVQLFVEHERRQEREQHAGMKKGKIQDMGRVRGLGLLHQEQKEMSGSSWQAAAVNPAYAPLHSETCLRSECMACWRSFSFLSSCRAISVVLCIPYIFPP